MAEAKVRLSFMVPGAVLLSSQVCEKNPKDSYDYTKVMVEGQNKKGGKDRELLTIATRKSVPAVQNIIISVDAYEYMISLGSKPTKIPTKQWSSMTAEQRLDVHMNDIAEAMGGYDATYQILDD